MERLEVVVTGSLYNVILGRLGAWWSLEAWWSLGSGSYLTPRRIVELAVLEAWL